ncbi:M61 family metallopeptidase [Anaeromyxobacter sp. PSR-1]|uniref:M61 family metallopeptidase n=1 Tax=Anaeromyxobacter sp. PSR-1 TaxID=1300915 RepID=UPI0005E91971|nr:PDZ domain-containing protein [Anaeromyxobacter sp. PSR-1]GAO01452.1 M61 glycyl aminopeptidase [Anaeromyxobacter sp. PSR-1]
MHYRLSMPEPHGHLFHVEVHLDRPGPTAELRFPVWTPGSYLVREYARHVEGLAAEDGSGRALAVERLDKHRVRVACGEATHLVLRYRVYANELTVRTCHLDGTHGYLNGAAVFPWVPGREREPHVLEVAPPAGWSVATALEGGPTTFTARDYDELADSPVEIGTHRLVRFEALGKPHQIALWGRGHVDGERLAEDARRIVEAHGKLMGGELPYDRYLFIVHVTDKRRGGLEHARSTTLNVARSGFFPRDAYVETLGLFSHEYFHLWNVKRLRPAAFTPFDYGQEQYTRLLWWFEGATSYYEQLALVRAGILAPRKWLENLGQALTSLERTPGAGKMSVEEASFLAWVKHYRPDENSPNSAISYYLKGELVALALDLALRRAGHSLDALLRTLYARFADGGVPEDGVERVAAELLGEAPARAFFDRYVRGTAPLEADLDLVGLAVRRRAASGFEDKGGTPGKPGTAGIPENGRPPAGWLGADLATSPKLAVRSVREGSPAWRAGLYAEDELVAEDGFRVDGAALWNRLCEVGEGGALRLTVFRRDELVEVPVTLGKAPEDTVWLEPAATPSPAQKAAFEAWAGAPFPAR